MANPNIDDLVRRAQSSFVAQTRGRIHELERQIAQIAPREVTLPYGIAGGFPASPTIGQQAYRPDLLPPGWYEWNGTAWVHLV